MPKQTPESSNADLARKKLVEARAAADLVQKFVLLRAASNLIYEDEALEKEIQAELDNLTQQIRYSLDQQFFLLDIENTSYEVFVSTLRALENWESLGFEFTETQYEQVKESRWKFDEKRQSDGGGRSAAATGALKDRYVAYLDASESKDEHFFVNDQKVSREEHLRSLLQFLEISSEENANIALGQAKDIARFSPTQARDFLSRVQTEKVDYTYNHGGKEKTRTGIPNYPLAERHLQMIKSYEGLLGTACEQEKLASEEYFKGASSENPYEKYEHFIKARSYGWTVPNSEDQSLYYLPGLDPSIWDAYKGASQVQTRRFEMILNEMGQEISDIPNLTKNAAAHALTRAKDALQKAIVEMNLWPGAGKKIKVNQGGVHQEWEITAPEAFEGIKVKFDKLSEKVATLQSAYNKLVGQDEDIRKKLASSDADERRDGVASYNLLKGDPLISSFLIFTNLSSYKTQQAGFDEGHEEISDAFSKENWRDVLRFSGDFISKPTYRQKCPEKIKRDVEHWRNVARQKLILESFAALCEQEKYYAARLRWERNRDLVDWSSVQSRLADLQKIEEEGAELFKYYESTLRIYALSPVHIVLKIIRDPDDLREYAQNLEDAEVRIFNEILGEKSGDRSGEQIDESLSAYLRNHLKKYPFEQKTGFLRRINFIAGIYETSPTDAPRYVLSFARHESEKLSRYLTGIVIQDAVDGLRSAARSGKDQEILAAQPMVDVIYEFNALISAEDREALKTVEVRSAEIRSAQVQPAEALKIWEMVRTHFDADFSIRAKYGSAKKDYYIHQAQKQSANEKYQEALDLISEGFDDPDVGLIWQLYLVKARVSLEMHDFEGARKAWGEARKSRKNNEIAKLEVDIELAEMAYRYQDSPVALMNSVYEYWKALDKKHKSEVERILQNHFDRHAAQYSEEIENKIGGNREEAWTLLLDLMKLEEIYLQVKPNVACPSAGYIEQILPTFYNTGVSLLRESDLFLQRISDNGVSLDQCIEDGEALHRRMVSYEGLLSSLDPSLDEKMALDAAIRKIIEKKVRSQTRKREFNTELDGYIAEHGGEKKNFAAIQLNRSRVRQNLDGRLKDFREKLEKVTKTEIWYNAARSVLDGKTTDVWGSLRSASLHMKEEKYDNFQEYRRLVEAVDNWSEILNAVYLEYDKLRQNFRDERLEEARMGGGGVKRLFAELKIFSNKRALDEVVGHLKGNLSVENRGIQAKGLDEIMNLISDLISEIDVWGIARNQRQSENEELSQMIGDFSSGVATFAKNHYEPLKEYLTSPADAKKFFSPYFDSVQKVPLIKSQGSRTGSFISPPRLEEIPPPSLKPDIKEYPKPGKSWLDVFSSRKSTVPNPLLRAVDLSAHVRNPISEQNDQINTLLYHLIKVTKAFPEFENLPPNQGKVNLIADIPSPAATRTDQARELKKEWDAAMLQRQEWIKKLTETAKKNQEIQSKMLFPKPVEIDRYYRGDQYAKIARRIVEASLVGPDDKSEPLSLDAYRDILRNTTRW